jgi:uncharacterized Tic20 family protein
MAKRKEDAMKKGQTNNRLSTLLPLFIVTVCIVFSFVFTVLAATLGPITSDIKFVFILMLVVTTTVASVVSVMFYVFMMGKQNGNGNGRRRRRR